MTRRLLTSISLAVAVVLSVSLVTAPVTGEAPMEMPAFHRTVEGADGLNVRIGDGLFRLRIQSGRSRMSVAIEVDLPRFLRSGGAVHRETCPRKFCTALFRIRSRPGKTHRIEG